MLENILPYEKRIFFLINGTHTDFLDNIMWLYSGLKIWYPLALFIIINIIYKKDWRQWGMITLTIVLLFTFCDQFSSSIMKPLFTRLRPTHHKEYMDYVRTLYGYRGGNYGFISGHATNAFGFAVLSSLFFKYKPYTIIITIWAAIMAYSRVYLGVHFISDVAAGALSGIIIGIIVYKLYILATEKLQKKYNVEFRAIYPKKQVKIMSIVIFTYVITFFILSGHLILFLK